MNVLSTNNYISYHWDGGGINLSWLTEEGYITFDERGEPLYHYYLRDHLGSVRVVFDQTGTVEQVNDYYPSGTLMYTSTNGTVQPYKFGQKELEGTGAYAAARPVRLRREVDGPDCGCEVHDYGSAV